MKRKASAFIVSASIIGSLVLGEVALPALALAKENEKQEKRGIDQSRVIKVEKQKKHEDSDNDDKELRSSSSVQILSATTTPNGNGSWILKIEALLTGGAGKSGKIPPGLLHAPGIWKKILGLIHVGTTTPDTVSPSITAASVSGITTTSAVIDWSTSEKTRGVIYYGTTSSIVTSSTTAHVEANTLASVHHNTLSGLSTSTTYFVKIVAKDAAGNATTSSEFSFTTAAAPDTVSPVISSVVVSDVSSTSARVSWTTNEAASGRVYYATTTPVVVGGAQTNLVSTTSLSTSHDFTLTGLTASTTYRFFVHSADAANNAASSSEGSFTTGH